MNIPNRPWILYLLSAAERVSMHRFETEALAIEFGDRQIENGICGGYEHFLTDKHPAEVTWDTKDEIEGKRLSNLMRNFVD